MIRSGTLIRRSEYDMSSTQEELQEMREFVSMVLDKTDEKPQEIIMDYDYHHVDNCNSYGIGVISNPRVIIKWK